MAPTPFELSRAWLATPHGLEGMASGCRCLAIILKGGDLSAVLQGSDQDIERALLANWQAMSEPERLTCARDASTLCGALVEDFIRDRCIMVKAEDLMSSRAKA